MGQRGMQFIVLAFTLQPSFIPLSTAEASTGRASVGLQMTCSHLTSCGSDGSERDLHVPVPTAALCTQQTGPATVSLQPGYI